MRFSRFNRLDWIGFDHRYWLSNRSQKKGATTRVAPFSVKDQLRLEHGFYCQSHTAVIDEPGTARFTTFSVQGHQGFRLGIRQIGTLQADRDRVSYLISNRTIQEAGVIIPDRLATDYVARRYQILGAPVVSQTC